MIAPGKFCVVTIGKRYVRFLGESRNLDGLFVGRQMEHATKMSRTEALLLSADIIVNAPAIAKKGVEVHLVTVERVKP